MRLSKWLLAVVVAWAPAAATAQSASSVQAPGGFAPLQAPCVKQANGSCTPISASTPLPIAERQESLVLATANAATAAQTVFGGTYIFGQSCTSYNGGLLTLRYRSTDGSTMLTLVSKTASDAAGGTTMALGTNAVVDVSLPTGSTGCNAVLARVP